MKTKERPASHRAKTIVIGGRPLDSGLLLASRADDGDDHGYTAELADMEGERIRRTRPSNRGRSGKPPAPNRPLPSDREEAFCQAIVRGLSKRAALLDAGYVHDTDREANLFACRLLKLPEIYLRIQLLRMRQAVRLNVTVDTVVLELVEAYDLAKAQRNPNAMILATMAKAKLMGLADVGSRDEYGRIPKPSPIPTDVVELDEKTWLEQFRPKKLPD